MSKFERDKVYKTRNGRDARVVCVDAPGPYSILGIVEGVLEKWDAKGREFAGDHDENPLDLMLPKPEPVVEVQWGLARGEQFSPIFSLDAAREWLAKYNSVSPGWRLARRTTEIID